MLHMDSNVIVCRHQIQKIWRGFWSRKKSFDFYDRKKYFTELEWKAELIKYVCLQISACYSSCQVTRYTDYIDVVTMGVDGSWLSVQLYYIYTSNITAIC